MKDSSVLFWLVAGVGAWLVISQLSPSAQGGGGTSTTDTGGTAPGQGALPYGGTPFGYGTPGVPGGGVIPFGGTPFGYGTPARTQ